MVFLFAIYVLIVFAICTTWILARVRRNQPEGPTRAQMAWSVFAALALTALICGGTCAIFISSLDL